MSNATALRDYVVLTPARNEAERLPRLAESLAHQTIPPRHWFIVENGSADATAQVARDLARGHGFARVLQLDMPRAAPDRGAPVVLALNAGIAALEADAGLVLKVDADVSLDGDYAERLIAAFQSDPRLGIASGACFEQHGGAWRRRHMTGHMVWCAARAWRRECLEQVLPFAERFGWDSIDVAKARLGGWRTRLLADLPFRHHRSEGERDSLSSGAWINEGRGSHFLGYRPSYLVLRALGRMRRDPRAALMIWGYLAQVLRRAPRYEDARVVALLREEQRWRHLRDRVRESSGEP